MKIRIIVMSILIVVSILISQENIINEIAHGGKFIVRDTELKESMVIENGDLTIFGNLKLSVLPTAESDYTYVVWDRIDRKLKIVDNANSSTPTINANTSSTNSTLWSESGGNIYRLNGKVGIGTTSPNYILDLKCNNNQEEMIRLWNTTGKAKMRFVSSDYSESKYQLTSSSSWISEIASLYNADPNNQYLKIRVRGVSNSNTEAGLESSTRMTILGNGNIGIGVEKPSAKLEIAGKIKITGGSPAHGKVLTSDGSGLASWQTPASGGGSSLWLESGDDVYRSSGNVGIGTSSPVAKLEVAGSAIIGDNSSSSFLHVGNNYFSSNAGTLNPGLYLFKSDALSYGLKLQYTDGEYGTMMFGPNSSNKHLSFGKIGNVLQDDNMVEYMRIDLDNGNVGIGTSTPATKLDVNGSVCATRYGTEGVHSITNGTWDLSKGNIAEVNFGSSITPITITSDECVGTYVLIVKKSSSCSSCSLTLQGVNIFWAYGTPPTLSSGSNTTDIISLIAVGNNTFYGYTANNFY